MEIGGDEIEETWGNSKWGGDATSWGDWVGRELGTMDWTGLTRAVQEMEIIGDGHVAIGLFHLDGRALSFDFLGSTNLPSSKTVELGVVIGTGGANISAATAMNHVGGYVVSLDMTARNWQNDAKKSGSPWAMAKGFDTFTPIR